MRLFSRNLLLIVFFLLFCSNTFAAPSLVVSPNPYDITMVWTTYPMYNPVIYRYEPTIPEWFVFTSNVDGWDYYGTRYAPMYFITVYHEFLNSWNGSPWKWFDGYGGYGIRQTNWGEGNFVAETDLHDPWGNVHNTPNQYYRTPQSSVGTAILDVWDDYGVVIDSVTVDFTVNVAWKLPATEQPKVVSISANPTILTLNKTGPSSGITFKATTDKQAAVTFKIRKEPAGVETVIGSANANGPGFIAEYFWNPSYASVSTGSYSVIATVPGSSKEAPFEIKAKTLEITHLTADPQEVFVDYRGYSSGIYFYATTSEPTTVSFSITDTNGRVHEVGSIGTKNVGGTNVAETSFSGWLPGGTNAVLATVPGSAKGYPFTVVQIEGLTISAMFDLVERLNPDLTPYVDDLRRLLETEQALASEKLLGFPIADPVNIVSGNYTFPEVDLRLKSRIALNLTRFYNSLDSRKGPFGRGWCFPFDTKLEITASEALFTNTDGSRALFTKEGDSFVSQPGILQQLSFDATTNTYKLVQPKGTVWYFNSLGKITSMGRLNPAQANDVVSFDYDTNNHLTKVTNPAGQWLQFSYNDKNFIVQVTDSTTRSVSYTYDDNDNLVTCTNPLNQTTTYTYSNHGFLTRVEQPGSLVTAITYTNYRASSVTSPDGSASSFAWATDTHRLTATDAVGTTHIYKFTPTWKLTGYEVIGNNLPPIVKTYLASGTLLSGIVDAMGQTSNYLYNSDGLLQRSTDPLGNSTAFEYHPTLKRLTKKTDALGREWRYTWDERGNAISETNPASGTTLFAYDSRNNCISRTDPMGRVTRFEFDETGNYLLRIVDPAGGISVFTYDTRGNVKTSSDQLSRTISFDYDTLDRLTKTVYPDGSFIVTEYDAAGNLIARHDHLGRETRYSYDGARRLLTTTRPDGTLISAAYDAAGNKVSETDPLGKITQFENNGLGLITKITYPDSAVETFDYDAEGRLTAKHDVLGNLTSYELDPLGRLLATVDPTGARWESSYDAAGRLIVDKDPLNRVTNYQFDALDRVTKVIKPDTSAIANSFDAVGNLLSSKDSMGNLWSWQYDAMNRRIRAIQPNGASSTTTFDAASQIIAEIDALGRTARYAFDLGGRKVSTTDTLGNVWCNIYDNAGRLTALIDPLNAVSSFSYDVMNRLILATDPLGNQTKIEFDGAGRPVAKEDALGKRFLTVYDDRGRVTAEVDPEARTVSYGYNLAGQRIRLTDGADRTWRWEYDALGRVTAEIDPIGNKVQSGYDAAGNQTTLTNARNETTRYAFDKLDRLLRADYPNGEIATFSYDLESRELSRSGSSGKVTKMYDSVGNLTSEAYFIAAYGDAKKWTYQFDLAGNRIQATDPEGGVYKNGFDALNRLVQLDPPGDDNKIRYVFDAAGRLIGEERPGVKTANTYDQAGRLLELKHERSNGTKKTVALRRYTYSPVGNRLTAQDEENGITKFFYDGSGGLVKAQYPDGQQVSYAYNGAGDRITETIEIPTVKKIGRNTVIGTDTVVIPFGYNAAGRMVSRASDTFTFDADGNTISATESGDETRYAWSADNRLIRVEKDIPCDKHGLKKCKKCQLIIQSETYSYVPEDWKQITRMVSVLAGGKSLSADTFVSVYDGEDESHEYLLKSGRDDDDKNEKDKKGLEKDDKKPRLQLIRQFIGGPGTDDLEATKYHGRTLELLKDGIGSTIALTNRGGNAVARVNYDAFGNFRFPDKPGHGVQPCKEIELDDVLDRLDGKYSLGESNHDGYHYGRHFGRVFTPYLYTSRRFDSFSNLYGNRNRMYSPKVGRFTSSDPIGFLGGQNRYAYVNNNPVIYTDPYGYSPAIALEKALEFVLPRTLPALGLTPGIGWGLALVGAAYEIYQSPMTPLALDWLKTKVGYGPTVTISLPTQIDENQQITIGNNPPLVWKTLLKPMLMAGPGGETEATKRGRAEHEKYNPGPGYDKRFTLPSGKKPDAVDIINKIVRELKPDNLRAIQRGIKQVQQYLNELKQIIPGDWKWFVDTYLR